MDIAQTQFDLDRGWGTPLPEMDSDQTLVLAFCAPEARESEGLSDLAARYPSSVVVGCSTSGEIAQDEVRDRSISVAIARFGSTRLRAVKAVVSSASESEAAGRELARQLQGQDLKAVFVLSEGLGINGTDLVRGVNSGLDDSVVVTGGLAGDGANFGSTWVMLGGEVLDQSVVAVGLYGEALRVGHGSRGGWDPFGPKRRVTRSEGNVLFELDGEPALALYKSYLGDRAEGLPGTGLLFPLAMRTEELPDRELVRTILAVDEEAHSLTFAGDMPAGSEVQLMKANFDRLVDGASGASEAAAGDAPCLCLAVSCVGRRLVLGDRVEDETEATLEALPSGSVQVGFYSYGELSPSGMGSCDLHNQTMTITTLWEAAE